MRVKTRSTTIKTPGKEVEIWGIQAIQEEMRRHGSHYWGPEEKRYFGSRTHGRVYTNKRETRFYFVESVKPPYEPRFYRVLRWKPSAPRDIDRVAHSVCVAGESDFTANEKFTSSRAAERYAEKCAVTRRGAR